MHASRCRSSKCHEPHHALIPNGVRHLWTTRRSPGAGSATGRRLRGAWVSTSLSLVMAQVDDVPGELLGEFIARAEALGARNVQAVASVTKKGRPGYLLYVDVPAALEHELGLLLAAELGCWGYRVLAAEHRHFDISRRSVTLALELAGAGFRFPLRAKTIGSDGRALRVKAEHDDLAAICAQLREQGHAVPLAVLKAAVETRLRAAPGEDTLEVRL
ncbi:MAG: pyridinium-3,5-bisthiocarboxylic acid mononucleotide nickel chelatase [Gammaproteobacteria bacterium]